MIADDGGVVRWSAEAERLEVVLPDDLAAAVRGYRDLVEVSRRRGDNPEQLRAAAQAVLVETALAGGDLDADPVHAAVDAAVNAERDAAARRALYGKAVTAAAGKLKARFIASTDRLIAEHLRSPYEQMLDQARRDRAEREQHTPNDAARAEQNLADLAGIVRLRDKLWGALPLRERDSSRVFWRYCRDNERFEDPRRLDAPQAIPSRLPPTLSPDWWRTLIDAGAQLWLPTPTEVRAREEEHEQQRQAKRGGPTTQDLIDRQVAKEMGAYMARQTQPKTPPLLRPPPPGELPAPPQVPPHEPEPPGESGASKPLARRSGSFPP